MLCPSMIAYTMNDEQACQNLASTPESMLTFTRSPSHLLFRNGEKGRIELSYFQQDKRWPQEADVQTEALKECEGYDQSAKRAEELHQAMLVQSFFNRTSSQLTEHGLLKLHEV